MEFVVVKSDKDALKLGFNSRTALSKHHGDFSPTEVDCFLRTLKNVVDCNRFWATVLGYKRNRRSFVVYFDKKVDNGARECAHRIIDTVYAMSLECKNKNISSSDVDAFEEIVKKYKTVF